MIGLEEADGQEEAAPPATAYEARLRQLMDGVAAGEVSAAEAARSLRDLPFTDLGFAKVDHHRELRQGVPEIVYANGKTVRQVVSIVESLVAGNDGSILVTRADEQQLEAVRGLAVRAGLPTREASRAGAIALVRNAPIPAGLVSIVTAGTSDLPVAEEAEITAAVLGARVEVISDVGVAGIHRVAAYRQRLAAADAVVVIAGMEGALASVVGGLVPGPVIACPTGVGYGATFGGLAALLSMLASCAPGVVCVNIDDGVGAGYAAALVARRTCADGGAR